jgi:IS5 family transposase
MASTHRVYKKQYKTDPNKIRQRFQVRNWKEYNAALVRRGCLTVWMDEKTLQSWRYVGPKQQGAPIQYSEMAITCALSLRHLFHLPLRATEGFLHSIFALLDCPLPVPHYTTLCRRARHLQVVLPHVSTNEPLHLVIDSTGIKVYGEGEWKVKKHGWRRHRMWRKVHIAVDSKTHIVHAVETTDNNVTDARACNSLLDQIDQKIAFVCGDGAYDQRPVYDALHQRGIPHIIPPRHSAQVRNGKLNVDASGKRNDIVKRIAQVGREEWKRESNYHRRSLVETSVGRLKTIFGDHVRSKTLDRQETDARIQCRMLNIMTNLGMPESIQVA